MNALLFAFLEQAVLAAIAAPAASGWAPAT